VHAWDGTRTRKGVGPADFKSAVFADFTTQAGEDRRDEDDGPQIR
jgi:hypothetical protein